MLEEFSAIGFEPTEQDGEKGVPFVLLLDFEITLGRFAGRIIDLGLQATPDYPRTVGSALHVRADPQLLELGKVPNKRNIVASALGPEWLYWSHRFLWDEERSARQLLSQINRVFLDA
jgi:hypothetical protein